MHVTLLIQKNPVLKPQCDMHFKQQITWLIVHLDNLVCDTGVNIILFAFNSVYYSLSISSLVD